MLIGLYKRKIKEMMNDKYQQKFKLEMDIQPIKLNPWFALPQMKRRFYDRNWHMDENS